MQNDETLPQALEERSGENESILELFSRNPEPLSLDDMKEKLIPFYREQRARWLVVQKAKGEEKAAKAAKVPKAKKTITTIDLSEFE
jgi:hypothetical protein